MPIFGGGMKLLNLLLWVTQFGFSLVFPMCFFLYLASWLRQCFGLGMWIVVVFGILGLLTTISTARTCLAAMRKAAEEASSRSDPPPTAFNDHK